MGAIVKAGKIFQVVLVVFTLILIGYCVDGINFAAWCSFVKLIGLVALTGGFVPVVLFQVFCGWIFP
jgi:hypothetical protein